jgi:hypothetical protein
LNAASVGPGARAKTFSPLAQAKGIFVFAYGLRKYINIGRTPITPKPPLIRSYQFFTVS